MTTVLLCTFFVCLAALWRIWHFRSICLLALHLTSAKLNRSAGLTLCLSAALSVCLSVCLPLYLTVRLSVCPPCCLQLWLHTLCLQSCTSIHFVSIYLHFRNLNTPLFSGMGGRGTDSHLCKLDIWFVFSEHTSTHVLPWALFGPNPACQRQDAPLSQKLTCYNRLRDMTPIPTPTSSPDFGARLPPPTWPFVTYPHVPLPARRLCLHWVFHVAQVDFCRVERSWHFTISILNSHLLTAALHIPEIDTFANLCD